MNSSNLKSVLNYLFLNEAHFGKFNMDVFKNLDTLQEKQDYASQNLQKLGEGSSRVAYALSTSKALKVVIYPDGSPRFIQQTAEKGWAQNEAEIEVWTNPKTKAVAAKIFDFDGDRYDWLVMEIAQPVAGPSDLGLPCQEHVGMCQLVDFIQSSEMFDDFISSLDYSVPREQKAGIRNELQAYVDNPPAYMKALVELVKNNDLDSGDLHPDHFGKTADGRIVLFDYGLTRDVYRNHYVYGGG